MTGSELDPDQQAETCHRQQNRELHLGNHHHQGHHQQSQNPRKQIASIDHTLENQRFEELVCKGGRRHSQAFEQVIFNRPSQASEEVTSNGHSHVEDQAASASLGLRKLKATHLENFQERPELTERADLVSAKFLGEPVLQVLTGTKRNSDMKISGNPSRVCRVCNKKFSSGRALGGHMRVHGPLFTPGSKSRSYGVLQLTAHRTQREKDDDNDDEDEESPSIIDAFEPESQEDLAQDARSEQASLSSDENDAKLFCDDGYGELDTGRADIDDEEFSMYDPERRLLSIACNSVIAGADDDEVMGAASFAAAKKSLLYKLRHNPKRSWRFAEQEFALEAQQAFMNFSARNSMSAEGVRVCSECGKAFGSEKALFGHMRCHPECEWRGVLPPEGSLEQRMRAMARYRRKRALMAHKFMVNSDSKINFDVEGQELVETAELEAVTESTDEFSHMKAAGKVIHTEQAVDGREAKVMQSNIGGEKQQECVSFSAVKIINDSAPHWRCRRSRRRVIGKAGSMETSSLSPEDEPALTSESISFELAGEEQELETPDCLALLAEAARKIEEDTTLQNSQLLLSTEKYAYSLKRGFKDHLMDEARHPFHVGEDQDDAEDEASALPYDGREAFQTGLITKYECTTCKKSFNTHQALGGHRASHKKTKGCFARTSLSDLTGEHSFAEELELGPVQEKDTMVHSIHKKKKKQQQTQQSVFKGHACSICHRTFLTGQALGGHKRCHWTGEKASEAVSVVSTNKQSSLQSEGQSSKIVEGGIDLNMPAPMDEDDEDGYGSMELHSEAEKKDVAGGALKESSEITGTSALAWTVKDLFRGDTCSTIALAAKREIEARRRFDGIWGQQWPNNDGIAHAQLPQQVYAMQSLV